MPLPTYKAIIIPCKKAKFLVNQIRRVTDIQEFITPPNHKGFSAKKLFDENGKIKWGAIAYIEKGGGGPEGNHTHNDNHIFIVVDGEAKVILDDKEVIIKKNESFFVDGMVPHSIWNNTDQTTIVIKISTERE